jgi:hypothetical protein
MIGRLDQSPKGDHRFFFTKQHDREMSALAAFLPKADIAERGRHVRFTPIADIGQNSPMRRLPVKRKKARPKCRGPAVATKFT